MQGTRQPLTPPEIHEAYRQPRPPRFDPALVCALLLHLLVLPLLWKLMGAGTLRSKLPTLLVGSLAIWLDYALVRAVTRRPGMRVLLLIALLPLIAVFIAATAFFVAVGVFNMPITSH